MRSTADGYHTTPSGPSSMASILGPMPLSWTTAPGAPCWSASVTYDPMVIFLNMIAVGQSGFVVLLPARHGRVVQRSHLRRNPRTSQVNCSKSFIV